MGLREEIFEQPEVLGRLHERASRECRMIASEIRRRDIDWIYVVARGSSDHAGLYGAYVFGAVNGIPVAPALPSLFTLYRRPPKLKRTLLVAVSQSGRSTDLIQATLEAKAQGSPTLVITNCVDSPLAAVADMVIDIGAGPERAVAATKSYTAQVMALATLSACLASDDGFLAELSSVPDLVRAALATDDDVAKAAEASKDMTRAIVLGRGYDYATAREWELKLKELTYVLADSYSSADFKHGPIAVIEDGFPVLAVNAQGAVTADMASLIRHLAVDKKARVLVVSNAEECLEHAQWNVRLPAFPERVAPLVTIVPAQLFAYHLTVAKGYDADHPRGLQKVTITE